MRHAELPRVIDALREPVGRFVLATRVRVALVVNRSGQVLAQHGFTSSYEVMNVASLSAAAFASANALAELTRSGRWLNMFHAGRERSLYLAPLPTPVEPLVLIVIFDEASSLGIVQLFYEQLAEQVATLAALRGDLRSTDAVSFERDLEAGLQRAFTSEPRGGG
jgi:predicted regulator of Ras-like GTPase activity (Roadblock/LC7/MglB family)